VQKTPDSFCQGQHDTKALCGIQEEHIFLKFPGGKEKDFEENMKTHRRRLPCIAADILRMTNLE
jgi:hypothetical protein